jgi:excisionase family DNA binding protein
MRSPACLPYRTRSSRPSCGLAELLDVPGVAARLKVSVARVRLLVRHQRIPFLRHGHCVCFERRRIDAWVAANPRALTDNHVDVVERAAAAGEDTA